MSSTWALALHGGAGAIAERAYKAEEEHMAALLNRGAAMLAKGMSARRLLARGSAHMSCA
jgi:L-asparaginase/beta-aspartyl-peptidase (threonine type)